MGVLFKKNIYFLWLYMLYQRCILNFWGMKMLNRRSVESLFRSELPDDFSARHIKDQCKKPFSIKFFDCQNNVIKIMAQRSGFNLSKIHIKLANGNNFSKQQLKAIDEVMSDVVASELRSTDQAFNGMIEGSEYIIVLPGTSLEDAQTVIHKIEKSIKESGTSIFQNIRCSFVAESLHSA